MWLLNTVHHCFLQCVSKAAARVWKTSGLVGLEAMIWSFLLNIWEPKEDFHISTIVSGDPRKPYLIGSSTF